LRRDGTRFPIEIRGMSSQGAGSRVKGILDLSRQKRMEEELDSFFRLSLDMFCILGFDGRFRRANPAWERTLGYCPESLVGSSSMDLVHPDDQEATLAQARRLAEGREMTSFENRHRHKDGTWRWLLWSASARPAEGVIYAVARDVTDRKRSEEENRRARDLAEEASRAKGRFLANMSHEIRTPMNGVVSMAGLLADTALDSRQRGYVKIIQTSARSLLRVINDILDFSKLEQGRLGLDIRAFDLRELVGDVADLFSSAAADKGLRLDWSFAPDMPRMVMADPGRLRQVLVNLAGNAVKFTEKGRVEIRARARRTTGRKLELLFEVEDTGPGIETEAGKRLFEPFSQLDLSDTRRHGGTGLGLAISKQLAELMEGSIGFESAPGQGTRFWFTIGATVPEPGDLAAGAPQGVPEAASQKSGTQAVSPPLRILVAEDNPINQMVAVCLLERLGHRAEIVANGREALDACRAIEYDVIFMDCQMPELDGYAATARIRRLERKGRRRPYIMAMTADALPGSRERCLAAGMDGYITKPVLIEDLKAALARGAVAGAEAPLATAPEGEADAVDVRIVERLRAAAGDDAGGLFGELVEGFLAQAREKLAVLEKLAAEGRADELAKAAHGLKGLSLNFGCRGMARVCDAMQRAAGAGAPGEAAAMSAGLSAELARAEERLKGLVATVGAMAPARQEVGDG
jgi:PAS domain S-box-containing protein